MKTANEIFIKDKLLFSEFVKSTQSKTKINKKYQRVLTKIVHSNKIIF